MTSNNNNNGAIATTATPATTSPATDRTPVSRSPREAHPTALPALSTEDLRVTGLPKVAPLDPRTFPDQPLKSSQSSPSTIPNVRHLLASYGVTARYNVIKKKLQLTVPGHSGSSDNFDNVAITRVTSLAILNGMNTGPVTGSIAAVGDENLFNPVADWITSKPWDGTDRLPAVYATLVEREGFPRDLKETLMKRWLLSAVAAAFKPSGFSCRGVLTLQGPQGIGKTKWTKALVSDPALAQDVIKLDHHLDAGNKDSLLSAVTHWIVEIGELDGSLKRDIARLKGFLTADQDKVRRPYAQVDSEYPRRTVFCATVNDSNFLVDPTGNTRWWTLPVVSIDYTHGIDMQQVFAQLAEDYENGAEWWLTDAEGQCLDEQNKAYRTESVIYERISGIVDLDRAADPNLPAMTSTEVLKLIRIEHPTNTQHKECCWVLRELFGDSKRIRGQEKWRVPVIDRDDQFGSSTSHDDINSF